MTFAVKVVCVDLRGRPVLGITLAAAADTKADERRENDVAYDVAFQDGPASQNLLNQVDRKY